MRLTSITAVLVVLWTGLPAWGAALESPQDSFFDSDGVRIRYVVRGAGPPVLLLHGFMVNTQLNWEGPGIIDSLASHYTVVAPDLRGHGDSDKPHDPSAYGTAFIDDVVRLLDHLEIERAHIVGYSMGAAITLKLLCSHPERVASAVLGGFGWRSPASGPADGVIQIRAQLERAARGETTLADIVAAPDSIALPEPMRKALNDNDLPALMAVQAADAELRTVTEAELRANTIPVLAITGDLDWAKPDVENMRDVMTGLEVRTIPGANHVTAVAHPLFLQAITSFLGVQRDASDP